MATWIVDIDGSQHRVSFESPMLGRKSIAIDGEELKKVGLPVSMWSNYKFDINGTPAVVKFRAIKRMKGMSLYVNGEKIEPEHNADMSAEALGAIMIGILVLIVGAFVVGIMRNT